MIEISAIIPVYNGEKYLNRCIDSILNQIFNNWEIILVDDGSTDMSGIICDKYAKNDERIKVVHKINGGVSSARNVGIDNANGKYITFIDCDDWVEKDFFEKAINFIKEKNIDVLVTGYILEDKGICKNIFKGKKEEILVNEDIKKEFFLQDKFSWVVYDKFFKKEIIKQYKFNTNLKIGEDMLFFWEILKKINKIGFLPLYKYHYDISASSTMTSAFSLKWFHGLKVKKNIYNEVKYSSEKIKLFAKILCIVDMTIIAKKAILIKNGYSKKRLIKCIQKILRKNIYMIVLYPFSNIISFRQRLGILFFCLPYKLCILLKKYLK